MLMRRTSLSLLKAVRHLQKPDLVPLFPCCISHRRYASTLNPLPVDSEPPDDNNKSTTRSSKVWDSVWTTTATLVCLGIAGYSYHKYYKWLTLKKIEKAFQPGDPALDLTPRIVGAADVRHQDGLENSHWVIRLENVWAGC